MLVNDGSAVLTVTDQKPAAADQLMLVRMSFDWFVIINRKIVFRKMTDSDCKACGH